MKKAIYLATLLSTVCCSTKERNELPMGEFEKVPFTPHKEDIGRLFWDHDSIPYTLDPYGKDISLIKIERNGIDSFVCVGTNNQYDLYQDDFEDYMYYTEDEIRSEECPNPKFYIDDNWDTIHREQVRNQIWKKFYWEMDPTFTIDENGDTILKRKVIRGPAAWKNIDYYLDSGSRTYEYSDTTKTYCGSSAFTYIGRGGKGFSDSL